MPRLRWLVLATVLGLGAVAFVLTRPAADSPVPAGIEPVTVDYARGMASHALGISGDILPVRFVEARCAHDGLGGLSVLYVYEAANPSIRSYAVHYRPPPAVPDTLANPSVILGLTAEEFAAAISKGTYGACA